MKQVFELYKMYFPDAAAQTIRYYRVSDYRIACLLSDGNTDIFSSLDNSRRRYKPYDHSESSWRRRFSNFLLDTLEEKMITQKELSRRTGISEVTISKYVNGCGTPTAYNLSKIERVLECEFEVY